MSDALDAALSAIAAGKEAPVYLVWGEEFLARKTAEELAGKLVPDAAQGLNYVTMDGASPREIASELATLPLFPGRKLVVVHDPEFLAPKKGRTDALSKAREAWKAGRRKEAARRVLALAARAGWGRDELDSDLDAWDKELGLSLTEVDVTFLREVKAFAQAEGLASASNDETALVDLLKAGAPKGQVLLLVATSVDAKAPLLKAIKDKGAVIERKVAGKLKDLDVTEFVAQTLSPLKKKLAPKAMEALKDRCGANMRLWESELQKLALYVDGPTIDVDAVTLLVGHAREEEFMELSDSLQKRDAAKASKYLDDAMGQGAAPLQILGAITSIVRGLLLGFERAQHFSQGRFPRNYREFEERLFPLLKADAEAHDERVPHPYAAFMGMQSAVAFGRKDLLDALVQCAEADLALKLGGGKLVLERLVWTVCGIAPPWLSSFSTLRRESER